MTMTMIIRQPVRQAVQLPPVIRSTETEFFMEAVLSRAAAQAAMELISGAEASGCHVISVTEMNGMTTTNGAKGRQEKNWGNSTLLDSELCVWAVVNRFPVLEDRFDVFIAERFAEFLNSAAIEDFELAVLIAAVFNIAADRRPACNAHSCYSESGHSISKRRTFASREHQLHIREGDAERKDHSGEKMVVDREGRLESSKIGRAHV